MATELVIETWFGGMLAVGMACLAMTIVDRWLRR